MWAINRTIQRVLYLLLGWAAFMALTVYAAVDAKAAPSDSEPSMAGFAPQLELDKPVLLEGEDGTVYLRIHFDVPEDLRLHRPRPAVNLALVIDRSGSMEAKGKMDYAKRAASMIVDRLSPKDRLAVVEYDDQVTVLWPAGRVEAKHMINRQISALYPRGSTNLTGGMMKGVSQLRPFADDEQALTRVILLSDGLANQGITDPRQIRGLVRDSRGSGVRVTTLGLGLDYNEDLMQDIAENGGGAYYYIEHPNQLARIFERELDSMFMTAAKDCIIRIEPSRGVRDLDVYGINADADSKARVIPLEDFYAGESRSLLVRLDVDEQREGTVKLGTVHFSYLDVATGEQRDVATDVTVTVSRSKDDVEKARNDEVVVDATLAEAERRQAEAIVLLEEGKGAEAQALMNQTADDLKAKNVVMQDARVANKIEALVVENEQMEVAAAAPSSDAYASFTKASKQRLYRAKQGKRNLYMLQKGDKGYEVEVLQQALNEAGYYSGPIDGEFDEDVANSLQKFQDENNLDSDGVAGPRTMDKLGVY